MIKTITKPFKLIFFSGLSCFVLIALLIFKTLPLTLPSHPIWGYRDFSVFSLDLFLIGGGLIVGICVSLSALFFNPARKKYILFGVFLGTILLNLGIYCPNYYSWPIRIIATAHRQINPFFDAGQNIAEIKSYPSAHLKLMEQDYWSLPPHLRRLTGYPPGLPLLYCEMGKIINKHPKMQDLFSKIAWNNLSDVLKQKMTTIPQKKDAAATAGFVAVFNIVILGVIPIMVFLLAKALCDEYAALQAAIVSALIPSLHLFVVTPDIYFALLSLLIIFLMVWGIIRQRNLLIVCSGVLGVVCLYLSYVFLPIIFFGLVFLTLSPISKTGLTRFSLLWATGVLFAYLVFRAYDYDIIQVFITAIKQTNAYKTEAVKGYWESVIYNPVEFVVFFGIVGGGLFIDRLISLFRNNIKVFWASRDYNDAYCLSLLIVFVFLNISGVVRGEVARDFMPLMPLFAVGTVQIRRITKKGFFILNLLMIITLLVMASVIDVSFGVF